MTERKPRSETWESFAERKIREAQEQGAFDGLPGLGRPISDLDGPDDADWWLKRKLRAEGLALLPPILEARLDAERTLESINGLSGEHQVRQLLEALNERIRKAHFSPLAGPADGVPTVDIEAVVEAWKARAR